MDQIGNHILPSSGRTFHDRGAEQVDIVAKDEKCAYTLLVASTADGDFLPFQQVWAGASERSLPSPNASRMQDALDWGFDFAFAKSAKKTSHFSTLKTMKEVSSFHVISVIFVLIYLTVDWKHTCSVEKQCHWVRSRARWWSDDDPVHWLLSCSRGWRIPILCLGEISVHYHLFCSREL